MLKHLHIENYALIESLDIDFSNGFSVITGETGAGKSILLGAIGLLTGGRADLTAIQAGKQRCIIEAVFDINEYNLALFFEEEDLEYDPTECIIRRELTSNGKSRAFINDTPTTVSALKRLGNKLIDIHSQHQNLLLGQEDFQLSVLDTIIRDKNICISYAEAYNDWKSKAKALEEAQFSLNEGRKDEDYKRFLLEELERFRPQADEDEYLQQQCEIMEHAQEIKAALLQGYDYLSEGETPAIDTLSMVRSQLSSIQSYFPLANELLERIESCRLELADISATLESEGEDIDYEPQRLEEIQSRLNTLYSLEQKHHVNTSEELIVIMEQLQEQINRIDNSDEYIKVLQEKEKEARNTTNSLAKNLSSARVKAAKEVEKNVITSLKTLGMPNVRFCVDIAPTTEPTPQGMDKVSFLFSANLGSPIQSISQVASGGEMARVMLSLKAMLSKAMSLPTIIFDEIDTGVSGQIAESMANIMSHMGQHGRQVISITHLPQIAALGQHHYKVWKEDNDSVTRSYITYLNQEERVAEVAVMLSGSSVTPEAISNARALLGF